MKEEKFDCMFQYATRQKVIVDTPLISFSEAKELWEKYLPDLMQNWDELSSPEMCIWTGCKHNADYHTQEYDIDFRDCELLNGRFYKVEKKLIAP